MLNDPPWHITDINPAEYCVYLAHHLGEAEASVESVRAHLRITGKLPVVGEPLQITPQGFNHKAFAIPYGKVVRIEKRCTHE